MIPNTLTLTSLAGNVGTDLVLDKVSEQNGESVFLGSYTTSGGELRSYRMTVKHTIPVDVTKSSSHLVKWDITRFNADGTLDRTLSVHTVLRSSQGVDAVVNGFNIGSFADLLQLAAFTDEFKKGAY